MDSSQYDAKCLGCDRSQGFDDTPGGIVKLAGDWVVNQYCGEEGFLGWLALQPRYHRMALSQLTLEEAQTLGPNIKALDAALCGYWSHDFPDDPIDRVYVVYFFESEFTEPRKEKDFHLHVHLIPRFRSLARALSRTKDNVTWNDGWRIPCLKDNGAIPEPYQLKAENRVIRATSVMNYIRNECAIRP